jgi:hypothetical protein
MQVIIRLSLAAGVFCGLVTAGFAQDDATGTPLEDITHDMKVSANHLSKKTTDKPAQEAQDDAVAKLDKLIAELEKERSQMGNSSSPNPSRPATASTVRSGPGGMGELHGTRNQGDRWGELPPHERDRILQSLTEGFPAHYQAILEGYYKRLAVEKRADEPEDAPPPAPKAAAKASNPRPATAAAPSPRQTPGKQAPAKPASGKQMPAKKASS